MNEYTVHKNVCTCICDRVYNYVHVYTFRTADLQFEGFEKFLALTTELNDCLYLVDEE